MSATRAKIYLTKSPLITSPHISKDRLGPAYLIFHQLTRFLRCTGPLASFGLHDNFIQPGGLLAGELPLLDCPIELLYKIHEFGIVLPIANRIQSLRILIGAGADLFITPTANEQADYEQANQKQTVPRHRFLFMLQNMK